MLRLAAVSLVLLSCVAAQDQCHAYDYAANYYTDILFAQTRTASRTIMTTDGGSPVELRTARSSLNRHILDNQYYMEMLTRHMRERVAPRTVHASGTGAFGYFEVTQNVTQYIRSKFLEKVGKRTKVAVRFSETFTDKGTPDSRRTGRGLGVKFYTEEGNLDLIGLQTPAFTMHDPIHMISFVHTNRRNPVTNIFDRNMIWDNALHVPEQLNSLIFVVADKGLPDGWRNMDSYMCHTYEVENSEGELYYVRFSFINNQGSKYLLSNESAAIAAKDPDYFTRDLYNAIARGDYPSWTLYMQVLTYEETKTQGFNVFNVNKYWPEDQIPKQEVGRLVLNRNPTNHHNDVEQAAYGPGNLVPGINGGMDTTFQVRAFGYRDNQYYRVGPNFMSLSVNRPITKVSNINRDGLSNNYDVDSGPNYYPSSFGGYTPYTFAKYNENSRIGKLEERDSEDDDVYGLTTLFYESRSDDERLRMAANLAASLLPVTDSRIQDGIIEQLTLIHPQFGENTANALLALLSASGKVKN